MEFNKIIFNDKEECIKIVLPQPLEHIFRYDEVMVIFCGQDGTEYVLYRSDFIIQALRAMTYALNQTLNGKRLLDQSIDKNIGYIWNQYLIDEKHNLKYSILPDGSKQWVGLDYCLWNGFEFESWLYEKDSQIILEVTPLFRWNRYLPEEENQLSYEKFMSIYKPAVVRVLSRETVSQWYKKAEKMLEIVEANDAQYQDILNAMPVFRQIDE